MLMCYKVVEQEIIADLKKKFSISKSNSQVNSSVGHLVSIQDTDIHVHFYSLYQSTC